MNLIGEVEKLMGDGAANTYRIIILSGEKIYIEGIKNVVSFGDSEMQFQLKKCLLVISGSSLKIKYLDKTTCVIIGKIQAVETR